MNHKMFFIFVIMIIPILITPASALSIEASTDKEIYGVGEPINFTVRVTPGEEAIHRQYTKGPLEYTKTFGYGSVLTYNTDSSGIWKQTYGHTIPGFYEITWSTDNYIRDYLGHPISGEEKKATTSFTVVDKIPEEKETEEKKVSLTLEHIPPTFDKDIQGGKIIVTLLNEKNEPIPNQHILIGPDMDLADVFENDYSYVYRGRITSTQKYLGITENDKVAMLMTDHKGKATWNYINPKYGNNLYLDSPELGKLLFEKSKAKKPVELEGRIRAWDYELYTTGGAYSGGKILANASIPVKFTHIAEISAIGTTDSRQKAKVRVMRIDLDDYGSWFYTSWADIIRGSRQVLPTEVPYKLISGDTVLLDENDIVTINWIDKTEMVIKTKKGFLENVRKETGSPVNAHFTIMYGDLGKMRKFQQFMNNWKIQLGIATSGGVVTCFTSRIAAAKFAIYYGLFFGTFKVTEYWDPLVIEMKSTILFDFDEDEEKATIYTVEGTGTLYNVNDGSTLDVTTGHKATVSPDGEFGSVTEFDESELNEDLRTILDYMRGEDISVSLKKGISFESRSKPSGSSVQIPLTLNGIEEKIGNMDMTLSYDPSILEATEVIKGGLTTDSLFDYNIPDEGIIKISLADSEGFSGDGSIAYVKFNVIGIEGSSSPLQITEMIANEADDYEQLDIQTNDGEFRVISMEEGMGDGDGDGEYTALDALYALQMAVGKIPEDLTMDINGDGKVSSIDAREILKIATGLEELSNTLVVE